MRHQRIANSLSALPELKNFPDLVHIFDKADLGPRPDWELPSLACLSVGGAEEQATIGCAAIACLQISIILIDDMLDDDPRGEFRVRGYGPVANLAAAFEAAAFRLLDNESIPIELRTDAFSCLSHITLATAAGQSLDANNLLGEENYWRLIQAKSTPFYGGALQIGAILGGADRDLAAAMYQIGATIGEIIQIEDDLSDAFAIPANPDWLKGRNNLLLLYASSAEHPDRERFVKVRSNVSDGSSLLEAQKILISSGALSYAAFNLIEKYKFAKIILSDLELHDPRPLDNILDDYAESLKTFLKLSGQDIPADLYSNS